MRVQLGPPIRRVRRWYAWTRRHRVALGVACVVLFAATGNPPSATASDDHRRVVDVLFPVAGPVSLVDTYTADRGGGRRHQGVDIFAVKGSPVYAAAAGRVCWLSGVDGPVPSYGYMVSVCATDGLVYHYIHMNNDTPGTDDAGGGTAGAYAPGLRDGAEVQRGQLLGYLGDSGNAEETPPHLHFEIEDPDLADPRISGPGYRPDRLDPYPSLLAARERGALPQPITLQPGQTSPAVAAWQEHLRRAGASLPVTGFYGPQTTEATRQLQRDRGITDDGIAGPVTMAALQQVRVSHVGPAQPPPPAPEGDDAGAVGERHLLLTSPPLRGADVESFQARLRALGYENPDGSPLDVDGIFGPNTAAAAAAFQRSVGFRPGPVGPRTLAALAEVEAAGA